MHGWINIINAPTVNLYIARYQIKLMSYKNQMKYTILTHTIFSLTKQTLRWVYYDQQTKFSH